MALQTQFALETQFPHGYNANIFVYLSKFYSLKEYNIWKGKKGK